MSAGYYPAIIPTHPQHPRRDAFEIAAFPDARGRGLVARQGFAAGALVAQLAGFVTPLASLDTLQLAPGLYMADPWFARFLLHACDPNCAVESAAMRLMARRAVAPGDVLSIDYGATEDVLGRQFECHCGAPNCRAWIMGRAQTATAEGRGALARRGAAAPSG